MTIPNDDATIARLEKEYPLWKPKVKAMPKNKFPCYYYYFFHILFGYSRVKYFSNSTIVGNRPELWATDFLLLISKSYIVYGFLKMFCYISFPSLFNHQSNIFFFEPQV